MSLNLNWGWKGIDFNMFWQTVLGRDMYNQGPMVVPFYNDNGNVWKDMVDQALDRRQPDQPPPAHELRLEDGQHPFELLYLRRLVPAPEEYRTGLHAARTLDSQTAHVEVRIYAGIQNAWTLTNFPGWDPERPSTNIASEVYPQIRIYNFGLNIGF